MNANTRILDTLPDSRKVFTVARALRVKPAYAFGCMVRWLTWVDAHCTSDQTNITPEELELVCFNTKGLHNALVAIGWVGLDENGFVRVKKYDKYLSPTSKARVYDAERKSKQRNRAKAADKKGGAK